MKLSRHHGSTQPGWWTALACALLSLSACVTKQVRLVNDEGETQTCKATGRVGIVSGLILHERMRKCIGKAEAAGFHEVPPSGTETK
jgi:hypothetical protein